MYKGLFGIVYNCVSVRCKRDTMRTMKRFILRKQKESDQEKKNERISERRRNTSILQLSAEYHAVILNICQCGLTKRCTAENHQ